MVEGRSGGSDDDEFTDEDEEKQMSQQQKDEILMKAVKENNYEGVFEALTKLNADPCVEENGWNPLLWAACNGNEDIVRILIKY